MDESDGSAGWSMSWDDDTEMVEPPGFASTDERLRFSDVGKLARRARSRVLREARAGDRPTLTSRLLEHLGASAAAAEVVQVSWPAYEHVNVQLGLDAWLGAEGRTHELLGLARFRNRDVDLSGLMSPDGDPYEPGPILGNVSWVTLPSGPDGQVARAVAAGLYLIDEPGLHAAVLLLGAGEDGVRMHVVTDDPGAAARIVAEVRELTLVHNVFRGQLISFEGDMFGERGTVLHFHTRPDVAADQVILPPETLAMIRRQVVGVAEHRAQLLAARQHLKRGLLLYGPPGVGKTHTVRHLISQLTDVTVVELSGAALDLIGTACSVARTLQPAMVVVEDVDLIAHERGGYGGHPLLFQLLNEMDGLAEDADVVFLLTTNRADVLEPALAARPGRVDQAVLMELPDIEGRRRLFALYRGDLDVDTSRLDSVIERTENVTASFLKELLRRSALIAAAAGAEGGPLSVTADQLDEALAELLDTRNAMTRVLLGGQRSAVPPAEE